MRTALEPPAPSNRKPPPRPSVLEPVKGFIDEMRREGLDTPAQQKHTTPQTMQRLPAEHDFKQRPGGGR
ncbi:hypothetical protein GCM10017562_75670 [Streptomyces roseofulvus]